MLKTDLPTRRSILALLAAGLVLPSRSLRAEAPTVHVHKDPDCGCCGGWVDHLRSAGFAVTVDETSDLSTIRMRLRVPPTLWSCHTAEVSGYAIEGHVPADAIRRLLETRPTALGLAVPGMPAGSPGMEGGNPVAYDVILFAASGQSPFMRFVGTKSVG
ncbi:DUF411 domain-containing protein [Rhodopseudomonas boonkerdii]|uniref:DUF411 domain-containing protein n=1 Tax=Rhodopseudomonas boonkerdii TaxID=475937 RepID=UPI001E57C81E|nr:DUF411 domain-containing protein [Rhodopseudomonas boonkerdii]UGV24770.1 DUF411 domain-containing protein [Rhodopseudomonas boonkerdii]